MYRMVHYDEFDGLDESVDFGDALDVVGDLQNDVDADGDAAAWSHRRYLHCFLSRLFDQFGCFPIESV